MSVKPQTQKRTHQESQSTKSKEVLMLELWAQLAPIIKQVFETDVAVPRDELMRLYGLTNNLINASDTPPAKFGRVSGPHIPIGKGSSTHRLYLRIQKYLLSRVENLAKEAVEITDDTEILKFYIQEASKYLNGVAQLNFICKGVNKWVSFSNSCENTREKIFHEIEFLASMIWKKGIFDRWGQKISNCIIGLVKQEREGVEIDQLAFSTVIRSLVNLGYDPTSINQLKCEAARLIARANNPEEAQAIKDTFDQRELAVNLSFYRRLFEQGFLEATAVYYNNLIDVLFTNETVSSVEYIDQLWVWLEQEQARAQSYLHTSTATQILNTILPIAITNHKEVFMNGLQDALSKHPPSVGETLRKMHQLCGSLGTEVSLELAEKVKQQVVFQVDLNLQKDIIDKNRLRDFKTYVKVFSDQYKFFAQLVAEKIRDDKNFVRAIRHGITDALASNALIRLDNRMGKSHEFLATRFHTILDHNHAKRENLPQDKVTSTVDDLTVLFALLPDTPTFETVYRNQLCSRLVDGSSVSDELEEQVIKGLAQHKGNNYVEKLYTVFRDWRLSVDIVKQFKKYCEQEINPVKKITISLEVTIFNYHAPLWSNEKQTFNLPKELTSTLQSFETFYSEYSKKKRHLTWIHSRSKGEIQASPGCFSDKKSYVFQCSLFQMSVILLYMDKDTLTFEEIVQTTGLEISVASQVLANLIYSKLLLEDKKQGEVTRKFVNEDTFSLNKNFTNNRIRVNLNANIRAEQQKNDEDKVSKKGEDEIGFILQSTIVRIMKTRKTIKEQDLKVEVIGELVRKKIHANPTLILSQVDYLVSKDFMKRNEGTPVTYEYIA